MIRRIGHISCLCLLLATSGASAATLGWSYDGGHNGQDDWGQLSEQFTACDKGTAQSPVAITDPALAPLPPLDIHYVPSLAHIHHNGHALIIDVDGKHTLSEAGHEYRLKRIVMHSPSEHKARGHAYFGEMQFMHEDAQGKKLILSVFLTIGESNPALEFLNGRVPTRPGPPLDLPLDPAAVLPKNPGYYAYTGSLTTPPCTEGVEWRIFKEPLALSKSELSGLARSVGRNTRLPQPVYIRVVRESE